MGPGARADASADEDARAYPDAADVVVVGYGPAGASAAIAAHDAGASVVIVEAAARGGGNARYSGGFLFDVPDARAVDHLDALCFGRTPRPVLQAYACGVHEIDQWLTSLGGSTEPFDPPAARLPAPFPSWPHFPAAHSIWYRVTAGGGGRRGEALWHLLDAAVRERGIPMYFETSAFRLVLDQEAVTGLLATRGRCRDHPARPRWRGAGLRRVRGQRVPGRRLPAARANLAGRLPDQYGHGTAHGPGGRRRPVAHVRILRLVRVPGAAVRGAVRGGFFRPRLFLRDGDGRRFADETGHEVHDRLRALLTYLPRNDNRPRLPAWAIFDEATRLAGPLNGLLGTPNDYTWSADNSAEVDRGWIISASSAADLAGQIGMDRAILDRTLAEYNAGARAGHDRRFGRSADTLVPLDTGRLYAIETWPGIAGTTGGPRHDERAQVVAPGGQPIPGLYAAGAVSLVWGHLIEHGGGLTDAIVFGRIAGREAAARAAGNVTRPADAAEAAHR